MFNQNLKSYHRRCFEKGRILVLCRGQKFHFMKNFDFLKFYMIIHKLQFFFKKSQNKKSFQNIILKCFILKVLKQDILTSLEDFPSHLFSKLKFW